MEITGGKPANIPLLIIGFIGLAVDILLATSLPPHAVLICSFPGVAVALLILWIGAPKYPRAKIRGFGMFHRDTRRTIIGAVVGGSVSIVGLAFVFFLLGVSWEWVLLFAALAPVELVAFALFFRERQLASAKIR